MRELAQSLLEVIADYRNEDGLHIDVEHVLGWVNQFADADRQFVLEETTHVLRQTYLSSHTLDTLVDKLVAQYRAEITRRRWVESHLAGNSQAWMLAQLRARGCDSNLQATDILFVDDIIFSGGRALQDIRAWTDANREALAAYGDVLVLAIIRHTGSWSSLLRGDYGLTPHLRSVGYSSRIEQLFLRKDGRYETDQTAYVLRCTALPEIYDYAEYSQHFVPRTVGRPETSAFSSDAARIHYERTMFLTGLEVRGHCLNLPKHMRPLGATHLSTPGFGALLVTSRNCPNNCPLAWWVDAPWFPLFPRRTNVRHAVEAINFDDFDF